MHALEIPFPNLQKQIKRSSNIQHCAKEHFQTITKDKRKKAKNIPVQYVLENAFVLQTLPNSSSFTTETIFEVKFTKIDNAFIKYSNIVQKSTFKQ